MISAWARFPAMRTRIWLHPVTYRMAPSYSNAGFGALAMGSASNLHRRGTCPKQALSGNPGRRVKTVAPGGRLGSGKLR